MAGFATIAIGWLNAYQRNALEPLINLYDDHATQTCVCDGRKVLAGKQALKAYWIEQFKTHTFSVLVGLKSEGDGGSMSYRTDIGIVQAHLLLNEQGKITHVVCGPQNP